VSLFRALQEAWSRGWVWLWALLVSLPILLDLVAALDRNPRSPTLTSVIVRHIPWPVSLLVWAWLGVHFWSRYAGRPIL